MIPNLEKYMRLLDRYDLSDGKKRTLIEAVFPIVESFVDDAFEKRGAQTECQGREGKNIQRNNNVLKYQDEILREKFNRT